MYSSYRAATNILTKIRNFRDIRTCQKGPKSDQKGTKIRPNTTPNVMTNHIIAPVHDHRHQELRHNVKKKQCEYTNQTHVIGQFTKF